MISFLEIILIALVTLMGAYIFLTKIWPNTKERIVVESLKQAPTRHIDV